MGLGPCLLLLLIGTALSEGTATVTSPKSLLARQWQLPLRDQRNLGICLHIYLERDFPGIERIVYPGTTDNPNGRAGSKILLDDGPSLEANCQQLYRLVNCFSRALGRMQYYEDFSEFRRLVVGLDAVLLQLCGAVDLMRHRFLPLLQTLSCMESVRAKSTCSHKGHLPPNIWHQLIRLEADSSLCWPLMTQLYCVRDSGAVRTRCGDQAQHLFANISAVFIGHWCLNTGSALSQTHFIIKILPLFIAFLPVFSLRFL